MSGLAQEMLVHRCVKQGQEPGLVAALAVDASDQYKKVGSALGSFAAAPSKTMAQVQACANVKQMYFDGLAMAFQARKREAQDDKEGTLLAMRAYSDAEKTLAQARDAAITASRDSALIDETSFSEMAAAIEMALSDTKERNSAVTRLNSSAYFGTPLTQGDPRPQPRSLVEGKATPWHTGEIGSHPCFTDKRLGQIIKPSQALALPGVANEDDSEDNCVIL